MTLLDYELLRENHPELNLPLRSWLPAGIGDLLRFTTMDELHGLRVEFLLTKGLNTEEYPTARMIQYAWHNHLHDTLKRRRKPRLPCNRSSSPSS